MAVDILLKIEGPDVEGESQIKDHEDEIDVLAWNWGVSNSGSSHVGGGSGAGKASVQDLSLTKWVDKASSDLALACCVGDHFDKATLVVRKAGGSPVDYMTMTMEQVLVTSVSMGASGGEDRLTENITLNFAKVNIVYQSQDAEGAGQSAGEMTFNIATNEKE